MKYSPRGARGAIEADEDGLALNNYSWVHSTKQHDEGIGVLGDPWPGKGALEGVFVHGFDSESSRLSLRYLDS